MDVSEKDMFMFCICYRTSLLVSRAIRSKSGVSIDFGRDPKDRLDKYTFDRVPSCRHTEVE